MSRAPGLARRAAAPVALALLLLAAGCGRPPDVLPSLAGLPLTHTTQGAEALAEIERLHGKRILLRDAWVGHYERDGAVAMLYVSRSHLGPVARWQFSRMVDGIGRGAANTEGRFTHLKARHEAGIPLYLVMTVSTVLIAAGLSLLAVGWATVSSGSCSPGSCSRCFVAAKKWL